MSYANPKPINPVVKFIEFGNGGLRFYDKEKKENINVKFPFKFIVVDEYFCITGYSDQYNCGIYSNEIKNIKKEELNISLTKASGFYGIYEKIKNNLKGMRLTKSIYAITLPDKEFINLKLKGKALNIWIESKFDTYNNEIIFSGMKKLKKGSNTYDCLIMEQKYLGDNQELRLLAKEKFNELKKYKQEIKLFYENLYNDDDELETIKQDSEQEFDLNNDKVSEHQGDDELPF